MFRKVLVANRGEIAVRVIRCLREMQIQSVALFSDPDRNAPHVRMADQAVHLPGSTGAETYMDMDKVFDAVKRTGAEAIHPGYGFLSERAEFAERCKKEGVVFIGPDADAIDRMGDKTSAIEHRIIFNAICWRAIVIFLGLKISKRQATAPSPLHANSTAAI